METVIVAKHPLKWNAEIPQARVVSPRQYITSPEFAKLGAFKVFNMCNAFKYQNMGYYVSLLAKARGHNPEPSVKTIMDFRSRKMIKLMGGEIAKAANRILKKSRRRKIKFGVYFGKTPEKGCEPLARKLFKLFNAPAFEAEFVRDGDGWHLSEVEALSSGEIKKSDIEFASEATEKYIVHRHKIREVLSDGRYWIAILVDEDEELPPSNKKALERFARAAEKVGFYCEFITKDDFSRLNEFDALFIRATTNANNFTYAFSRTAEAEGLAVVDDASSIIRCANKVFQAEQAAIRKIPIPQTMIVHRGNVADVSKTLSFPVVIKQPDSQFSQGVYKAEDEKQLEKILSKLLDESDLLIAQEFVPTEFDWRIGIFDKKPIFACKYYMAKKHWQIVNKDKNNDEGASETLPVYDVPRKVLDIALKTANLIGDGLYGVDIKQTEDGRTLLIEINDNPNIDAGIEDKVAGSALYEAVMLGFMERVGKIRKLATGKRRRI